MTWSLDIWYVASPGRPSPSLFKSCPWGQKWPHPRGQIVYIGLYGENMKKIFWSEITRPRALSFGMKHHLVVLYQVCSNYTSGATKWPHPGSHMFYIGLYSKNMKKILLSETLWHRVLIFGTKHHLVDLYQVYSNYAPGAKKGSDPGVTCFT